MPKLSGGASQNHILPCNAMPDRRAKEAVVCNTLAADGDVTRPDGLHPHPVVYDPTWRRVVLLREAPVM